MRTTLAAINQELVKHGYTARLAKESGHFYFKGGEATGWLDRTVRVDSISDRTIEQWTAEFERLRARNAKLAANARAEQADRSRKERVPKGK
jgi:hypothetical protein